MAFQDHFRTLGGRVPTGAAAGLTVALLLACLAGDAGAAPPDPLAEADPAPRYRDLPDVAPPASGVVDVPSTADAGVSAAVGGGLAAPGVPRIIGVACVNRCVAPRQVTPGAVIRIKGIHLGRVRRVVFHGKTEKVRVAPKARRPGSVRVVVPSNAGDGTVRVIDRAGIGSNWSSVRLRVLPVAKVPREVFPVRGPVSFGGEGSRFGAGRRGHVHQGQDVSAACRTPVVSVRRGTVIYNAWDDGGGNYVVIDNAASNTQFVYMHLIRRSPVKVGTKVQAGTEIGRVGSTGVSSGCHLHFEYWVGPWQTGGKPLDPLRYLRSLRK